MGRFFEFNLTNLSRFKGVSPQALLVLFPLSYFNQLFELFFLWGHFWDEAISTRDWRLLIALKEKLFFSAGPYT